MEYLMSEASGGCIFCDKLQQDDDSTFVLLRTEHSFIALNAYPYNNGHLLISPFRHVPSLSELTSEERADLMGEIKANSQNFDDEDLRPVGSLPRAMAGCAFIRCNLEGFDLRKHPVGAGVRTVEQIAELRQRSLFLCDERRVAMQQSVAF